MAKHVGLWSCKGDASKATGHGELCSLGGAEMGFLQQDDIELSKKSRERDLLFPFCAVVPRLLGAGEGDGDSLVCCRVRRVNVVLVCRCKLRSWEGE